MECLFDFTPNILQKLKIKGRELDVKKMRVNFKQYYLKNIFHFSSKCISNKRVRATI
jgi:hypothetical protein